MSESYDIENPNDVLGIIYKATNVINNKVYIGQTIKSLEQRKHRHESGKHELFIFQRAIQKYGKENFDWEILDVFYSKEDAKEKEQLYIWLNNSWEDRSKGYNLTRGGEWGDTISHHPHKKEIIERQVQTAFKNNSYKRGKDNSRYGKNDHCFGIKKWSSDRKGKTNEEVYGTEKSNMMRIHRIETKNKRKQQGIKIHRKEIFPVSNELIKFIYSYAYYDTTIMSFKELFSIFKTSKRSVNCLHLKSKKRFPEEHSKLNRVFRSRQTSGERNGRYGKSTSLECRQKISDKQKGHISPFRKLNTEAHNRCIQMYFEGNTILLIAQELHVSGTTIKNYLKKVNIPLFYSAKEKEKQQWIQSHRVENYYVK